MGCRTVGIAGGPIKTKLCLDEFGYDVAIDYKAARSIDEQLADACPNGVDVYFDNTSGPISDAVMARLSVGARVVICGTASVASWDPPPLGPRVERHILVKRARMSSIINTATSRRSNVSPNGSAMGSSVTSKRFQTELNIARQPLPSVIAEKILARN
jgi:NADPH-dependent curcumin reductase